MKRAWIRAAFWTLTSVVVASASARAADEPQSGGGGLPEPIFDDRISSEIDRATEAEVERNAVLLGLDSFAPEGTPAFIWPVRDGGGGFYELQGVSQFVDQDTDAVDIQDFACGDRTYDGHHGIDIVPWPYLWRNMDLDLVKIVAAAPGTIVGRFDGFFDRNCACETNDANRIIVQHADGSRAWYFHMKNGSLTPKTVGMTVVAGEELGTIGSSGCSSIVHLHFEVHDAGSAPGALFDPFDGACNALNPSSLWASQPVYLKPTIAKLTTNFGLPTFAPACPATTTETPREKRIFSAGDSIFLLVFLYDENTSFAKHRVIRRPDGSEFFSDDHTTSADGAKRSYWFLEYPGTNAITSGPTGRWSWEVTMDGTTRKRAFWVGAIFADDFEDANLGAWN